MRRSLEEVSVSNPSPKTMAKWDIIEPVGKRVVIRKDDNKRETKSGIVLPGNHEIPTLTGRVIAISKQIERDEDFPIRQYDKVLFDPRDAVPVEFEPDNRLFVVPLDKVLAIFRKAEGEGAEEGKGE
jgi:chaperonin GroES